MEPGPGSAPGRGRALAPTGMAMGSSDNETFELMIKTGPDWETHHVYGAGQASQARNDAKPMEGLSTTKRLKIVRVTVNPNTGEVDRQIVYKYPKVTKKKEKITTQTAAAARIAN